MPAGCGVSTVHADMDFEAFSTGGYRWDPDAGTYGKWRPIADKKGGIGVIGSAAYAEHPSTEVISLAYDLKDGLGERLWVPGCPSPVDLFGYIAQGGLIEAWNSIFEFLIWDRVCVRRLGWPPLPLAQLRCASAKARLSAWPRALGKAAEAMHLDVQKDTEGKRLIRKFSIPRSPTKKDRRQRIRIEEDPKDGPLMLAYNIQDIKTEAAASAVCPDLSPQELEIWLLDQKINERGVYIDPEGLAACLDIVRQATAKYTAELIALTGGAVQTVNEVETFKKWLNGQGVPIPNMQKATVDEWANKPGIPTGPHRALEIRALLGSAAVKKLFAMEFQMCTDGRLRGLYVYSRAHTTRWSGEGPQPQNLTPSHKNTPGHPDRVQYFLEVIASRSLPRVESTLGNPIAAVSGCLRGLFSAPPGTELISSDYSAIEAVVNAVMAGEQWRIDVFEACKKDPGAPDIYETSASKTTGVPVAEIVAGRPHPLRKGTGKTGELACLGADTPILTDSGWKRIVDVTTADLLHDGTSFVTHRGVIDKGARPVVKMGGLTATPDHKFYTGGDTWATMGDLKENTLCLKKARGTARSLLKSASESQLGVFWGLSVVAIAETLSRSTRTTCSKAGPHVAIRVQRKKRLTRLRFTPKYARIKSTVAGCGIACPRQYRDARTRTTDNMGLTALVVSLSTRFGSKTGANGCRTYLPFRGGMTRKKPLTEQTMLKGISQGTYDLGLTKNSKIIRPEPCGSPTVAKKCPLRNSIGSMHPTLHTPIRLHASSGRGELRKKLLRSQTAAVYDVIGSGPHNRFVVLSNHGPLIAHNSGYGGWIGAWKAFGAEKYFQDDREIRNAILAWREASPNIVEAWGGQLRQTGYRQFRREFYGVEGAAVQAILNPGVCYPFREVTFGVKEDVLYCRVPSGELLTYHHPRLHVATDNFSKLSKYGITYMGWNSNPKKGPTGWMRLELYGGLIWENIIQKVARDIFAHAMPKLEAAGYLLVMHTHDEPTAEVPLGYGSIEEFESIMCDLPEWAAGWPINATGGWRGRRFRKD